MTVPVSDGNFAGTGHPHFRTGTGVDAHAFSLDRERPMWLAGLYWPGEIGIEAHSDGDVVAHAICDALFGAAGGVSRCGGHTLFHPGGFPNSVRRCMGLA